MRKTGLAILSVVAITAALVWWAGRDEAPPTMPSLPAPSAQPAPSLARPLPVVSVPVLADARIEGHVLDAQTRLGIAGARLDFEDEQGVPTSVRTDAAGHFALPTTPTAAVFLVQVSAKNYASPPAREAPFQGAVSGIEIELKPWPILRGRVIDVDGRAIEGALIDPHVSSGFADRDDIDSQITDAKGEFSLARDFLARLRVSHPCCSSALVKIGEQERELVITLERSAQARTTFGGTVVDEDQKPVRGAVVSGMAIVSSSDIATPFSASTDANGRFSVEVLKGSYLQLRATHEARASVEEEAASTEEVTLHLLDHAGSISGRVTNQAGEPVTAFTVRLHSEGLSTELDVTSADGRYELVRLPALYASVAVMASGYLISAPVPVKLARGQHATADLVLLRGRTVTGIVYDLQTREPLAWANLRRLGEYGIEPGPNGRARTDAVGHFVLTGLRSGRVEVRVSRSGYLDHDEVFDTTSEASVRIGLNSTSRQEDQREYVGVGQRFDDQGTLDAGAGYFVTGLHPQGGALVAGIQVGDEILSADGVAADSVPLKLFLRQIKGSEGTVVTLTVRRGDRTFDVHAVRRRLTQW